MVQPIIVNWLLTRKCNLSCNFCGIIRQPKVGYNLQEKIINELRFPHIKKIIDFLAKFEPKPFIILYGGEPTLHPNLEQIVDYLNEKDFPYTIISNGVGDYVQERLINLVKHHNLKGFSMSLDPLVYDESLKDQDPDRYAKSKAAYDFLVKMKELKPDLDAVAEITVDNKNVFYLEKLLQDLTERDIWASITVIESPKNEWYDFAATDAKDLLIKPYSESYQVFKDLIFDILNEDVTYKVHFRELLKPLLASLPMKYRCNLEPHNLTIDADGEIRLCLRIHGEKNPNILDYVDKDPRDFMKDVSKWMKTQKDKCEGCAWTCIMMTQLATENPEFYKSIVHDQVK